MKKIYNRFICYILTGLILCTAYISTSCVNAYAASDTKALSVFDSYTGSAKYLDGDTIIIGIYLCDKGTIWTKKKLRLVEKRMDTACDFLVAEGKKYGKSVNLIYNTDKSSDLCYNMFYDKPYEGSVYTAADGRDGDIAYEFYEDVRSFIRNQIPVNELMEQYRTDSVGFVVFMDTKADMAVTYPYYCIPGNTYYYEISFINLYWSDGRTVAPSTYAHELLHLFGARDLYATKEISGISKEFINYVYNKYPKDIMLGHSGNVIDWEFMISYKITDVTAYFLGWKDYISELELFPDIKSTNRASFKYIEENEGKNDEYETPGRTMTQKYIVREAIFVIFIAVVFFISYKKERKRYKGSADESDEADE